MVTVFKKTIVASRPTTVWLQFSKQNCRKRPPTVWLQFSEKKLRKYGEKKKKKSLKKKRFRYFVTKPPYIDTKKVRIVKFFKRENIRKKRKEKGLKIKKFGSVVSKFVVFFCCQKICHKKLLSQFFFEIVVLTKKLQSEGITPVIPPPLSVFFWKRRGVSGAKFFY